MHVYLEVCAYKHVDLEVCAYKHVYLEAGDGAILVPHVPGHLLAFPHAGCVHAARRAAQRA